MHRSGARWHPRRAPVSLGTEARFRLVLVAASCVIAAGIISPARASAASPLAWSNPALIDNQGPFATTAEVRAVSCPATSLCVAAGDGGKVLTSTDPADAGTATWTEARVDGENSLNAVSCISSPSLCVAVDDQGNVVTSTDPTDGPAAKWTVVKVDAGFNNATRSNNSLKAVRAWRRLCCASRWTIMATS
jgi:hypothetical protein